MDKHIDTRFERVEKALASLIDSISKYNPSTAHATELAAADAELSKGLEELQTHQNNYLRIQQLQSSTANLDSQIRETLRTLATTRRDITTTSTTVFPDGPHYDIKYDELLSYARRISKTTLPPNGAVPVGTVPDTGDATTTPAGGAGGEESNAPNTAAQTPLTATTPMPTTNGIQTPAATGSTVVDPSASQATVASSTAPSMPENLAAYLNPLSGAVFVPWPAEDKIRAGSLASNQLLVEQGLDPRNYDPVKEEERRIKEEEERKEAEERERLEREEHERRMREERERVRQERERAREKEQHEAWRRGSVVIDGAAAAGAGPAPGGQPEKKQFQFMDALDDDDE